MSTCMLTCANASMKIHNKNCRTHTHTLTHHAIQLYSYSVNTLQDADAHARSWRYKNIHTYNYVPVMQ